MKPVFLCCNPSITDLKQCLIKVQSSMRSKMNFLFHPIIYTCIFNAPSWSPKRIFSNGLSDKDKVNILIWNRHSFDLGSRRVGTAQFYVTGIPHCKTYNYF